MFSIIMAIVWLAYLIIILSQPRIRQIDLTLPVLILIIQNVVEAVNTFQSN